MEKTWMPTVAGILNIVSGAFGLVGGLLLIGLGILGGTSIGFSGVGVNDISFVPLFFFGIIALPLIILSILAIVGGIYALQRKIWGLALAGSISATLFSQLLGIPAIIFIALSKNEFE